MHICDVFSQNVLPPLKVDKNLSKVFQRTVGTLYTRLESNVLHDAESQKANIVYLVHLSYSFASCF